MENNGEENPEEPKDADEETDTEESDREEISIKIENSSDEAPQSISEDVTEEFTESDEDSVIEEGEEEEKVGAPTGISKEEKEKLVSQVEAALFLAGRPLGEMELANSFGSDRITVRWALRRIKRMLEEQNSALEVLHLTKDRWVLQLCEEFSRGLYDYIEQFIPKEEMLTRLEIDTLTEIAYRQPITTTNLVKILGRPDVYDDIRNLTEKGLVILEKEERSNILRTSSKFADIFGFDTEMRNLKIQLVWRLKKRAQLDKN